MNLKKQRHRDAIAVHMQANDGWLTFSDCFAIAINRTKYGVTRAALGVLLCRDGRFVRLTSDECRNDYATLGHAQSVARNKASVWALKSEFHRWEM